MSFRSRRVRFAGAPRGSIGAESAGTDPPRPVGNELAGWVDPVTGVIPALLVEPAPADGSSLPIVVSAAPPHVVDEDGLIRRLPVGWGKGLTANQAAGSALGEAIERYAASLPDVRRIVWRTVGDLDGDVLDPRDLALYAEEQYARPGFPFARFDPGLLHPWVRGHWLDTGREVWVHAVFVFLSLTLGPENLICQGTSNGLAASTDLDDAALRATLELVERDAFMAAWLSGTNCRPIELDGPLEPRLRGALDWIERQGASVELRLLPTSTCGTSVMALALGDGETWPGVTMGLAADLDPSLAVRGAILELFQTGPYLRRLLRSRDRAVPPGPDSVHEMLDHATFYFPPARATAFDGLRSNNDPILLSSLTTKHTMRSQAACASALSAAGVRVAIVDVTSADVAIGPFRVVRAVSSELQPISYGHGLARLPVERIRSVLPASEAPPIHPIW